MMIASGLFTILLTVFSFLAETRFRQIFSDLKVQLPWITQAEMAAARIIWTDYGWVILIPIMIAWPFAIVPILPVPRQPDSRRTISRTTRYLVSIIFFFTAAAIALGYFGPMVALITAVSGPQKN